MNIKQLKKRWKRALSKRQPWEQGYQECYDYTLPGRQSFFERNLTEDAPEIFDETAVVGIQEFASRMQAGLVPNFAKWIKLEASETIEESQRTAINQDLEKITQVFFEHIHASNFAEEAHECLIDIALGTATMEIIEGDAITPIVFNATPLPELALEAGPRDEIGGYFRARKMRVEDIERSYGAKVPEELKKSLCSDTEEDKENPELAVVHAVYRDYEQENEYAYWRCVFLPDAEDESGVLKKVQLKGFGANPYVGFRWSKVAGEVWGRGPIYNLMPTIRVLNLVKQLTLENAEIGIAGMYTYEDDGVLNPDNIVLRPGSLLPVAPGSQGIRQFNSASDFTLGDFIINDMKNDIRKGLYNETLGSTDTTPMSATEVAQRMADLSRQIGSAFGRLQVEFVNQVVNRVLYILNRRGIVQVPRIDGRLVKVVATSPLAQAQAFEEIQNVQQWLGMIANFYGPQGVNLYTDGAQVAKLVMTNLGVPQRLYRDDDSRAEMVSQLAQAGMSPDGEMSGPPTQGIAG